MHFYLKLVNYKESIGKCVQNSRNRKQFCFLQSSKYDPLCSYWLRCKSYGFCFLLKRKLADKVAATGYYVVVPDFLYGDPFNPEDATRPLPVWLKDHPPVSSSTS